MKVKAKTDFGGQYAMFKGDVAEIPEGPVADILIAQGYVETIADGKVDKAETTDETEDIEADTTEPEEAEISFKSMTVAQLLEFAEENEIEVDPKAKKAEIIAELEEALQEEE